jgi:hypothetical protein
MRRETRRSSSRVSGGGGEWRARSGQREADRFHAPLSRTFSAGENGIMKKKFAALSKEIDENREEVCSRVEGRTSFVVRVITPPLFLPRQIKRMLEKQAGLRRSSDGLEKEIAVLRTLVREKDSSIGEKERRIYELKVRRRCSGVELFSELKCRMCCYERTIATPALVLFCASATHACYLP